MGILYDVIIIGGGHNGLVTGALLANSGHKVLILERRQTLGGAAATEEIFPGYHINTGSDDAGLFHEDIERELFLKMHGLDLRDSPVAVFAPQPDGANLTLWRDVARSAEEIQALSRHDGERFPDFVAELRKATQILKTMMLMAPPDLAERNIADLMAWGRLGLQVKRLSDKDMMGFMRVLPMPVSDYLNEWFEDERLKGLLAADGISGGSHGPKAAGTALLMLYRHTNGFLRSRFAIGGIGRLSEALASAARNGGADIRFGTTVDHINLRDGQATGVALAGGEEISARIVISSADPRSTFFDLVGPTNLEPRFMRAVRNIIFRGSTAKVNLALNALPQFNGQTEEGQLSGHIRISPSLEYLERASDDAKYGRISHRPYLDMVIPTLTDPALAPPGQHILSITMQYAPYKLADGHWNDRRDWLGDHILDCLTQYAPNLKDNIAHRQVITPMDWEQTYGLTEGSILHGQMNLDQLFVMRPVPGWSQYRTPIKNLFLCGAGAHPGGGVTGLPGQNAARVVSKALAAAD